jgi:predicted CXXCH cytochrome family protein
MANNMIVGITLALRKNKGMSVSYKTGLFLCVWGLCFSSGQVSADPVAGCLTGGCHSEIAASASQHQKIKECGDCHIPLTQEHPVQGEKTFRVDEAEVCTKCHARLTSLRSTHRPVADGECSVCHEFHGGTSKLLRDGAGKQICLGCHPDIMPEGAQVIHAPLKDEGCVACHLPHGSAHEKLLIEDYSSAKYLGYTTESYKFCFKCHQREIVRFPDTGYSTEFRDGERNLHYLHVNMDKNGKNCKLCHVTHTGNFPKLLAEQIPFGNWSMPMNFKKTATGGSCAPGCHKTRTYDRQNLTPVDITQ